MMIKNIEEFVSYIGNTGRGIKLVKKEGQKTYHTVTQEEQPDHQLIIRFIESESELQSVWFDLKGDSFNKLQERINSEVLYKRALLVLFCKQGPLAGTYIVNTRKFIPKLITNINLLDKQKRLDMYLPSVPLDKHGKWRFHLERSPSSGYYFTILGEDKGNKIPVEKDNYSLLDETIDKLYCKGLAVMSLDMKDAKEKLTLKEDGEIKALFENYTIGKAKIGQTAQAIFQVIDKDSVLFDKVLNYINSEASRFRVMYGAKILRPIHEGKQDHLGKDRYYANPLLSHNYFLSNHWIKGQDDEPLKRMLLDLELI